MSRYEHLKTDAARYARDELGWADARAVDAKPAGVDGRSVAVLISPHGDADPGRGFVIAFDEWDRIATDAGSPGDFGWSNVEMF